MMHIEPIPLLTSFPRKQWLDADTTVVYNRDTYSGVWTERQTDRLRQPYSARWHAERVCMYVHVHYIP